MSNRLSIQSYLFILFFFSAHHISAEGSKEMSPNGSITILGNNTTDIAALHINSDSYNNFASYNNQDDTSRLHIHIADPQNEIIYLGFSNGHLNQSVIDPTELDFEYRIKDPNGNIVFGPVKICAGETGPGIIDDWLQGNSGPIQLGNTDGYFALTVNSSDLMSAGWTGKGDYYIEFDAGDTNFLIDFWDISVVDRSNGALTEKNFLHLFS